MALGYLVSGMILVFPIPWHGMHFFMDMPFKEPLVPVQLESMSLEDELLVTFPFTKLCWGWISWWVLEFVAPEGCKVFFWHYIGGLYRRVIND